MSTRSRRAAALVAACVATGACGGGSPHPPPHAIAGHKASLGAPRDDPTLPEFVILAESVARIGELRIDCADRARAMLDLARRRIDIIRAFHARHERNMLATIEGPTSIQELWARRWAAEERYTNAWDLECAGDRTFDAVFQIVFRGKHVGE